MADVTPLPPRLRLSRAAVWLAAAWCCFAVVHPLLSGRWWLWVLPGLLPPPVFLLAPLLPLAVLHRLSKRARVFVVAATAVSLAVGAGLSGVRPSMPDAAARAGPGIRVLAWNTQAWHLSTGPESLYRQLREADADLLLLQEYQPEDQKITTELSALDAELIPRLLPGYRMVVVGELLTLTRLPIVGWRQLPTATGTTWIEKYASTKTLRIDVQVGGRTLSVYNTHLPVPLSIDVAPWSAGFYRILRERHDAREVQLRALVADVAANPNPILLAGDLNTTPAMGELRALPGILRPAPGGWYPASWPSGLPLWRLDWAFTGQGARALDYRLAPVPGGISDHLAQHLTLSLDLA